MPSPATERHIREAAAYVPRLRRYALGLAADADEAEDLVQDTMLAILCAPRTPEGPLLPWLMAVLKNRNRLRARTRVRQRRRDAEALYIEERTPEVLPVWWEDHLIDALNKELLTLEDPLARTLKLYFVDGLTSFQVAERLNIPAATVRRRVQRAIVVLRNRLEKRTAPPSLTAVGLLQIGRSSLGWKALLWRVGAAASGIAALVGIASFGWLRQTGSPHSESSSPSQLASRSSAAPDTKLTVVPSALHVVTSGTTAQPSPEAGGAVQLQEPALPVALQGTTCPRLQTLVSQAPAFSTLLLPPCTFREQIIIDKPLTIDGRGHAEVLGSDVFHEWHERQGEFVSTSFIPKIVPINRWPCAERGETCGTGEQVFRDGAQLRRAHDGQRPLQDEYAITGDRNVVLATNPHGHTVEVTVRTAWLRVNANDVTVQGVAFRHAGSFDNQLGAIDIDNPYARFTLKDTEVSFASGTCVAVGGQQHQLQNNKIANCGTEGIFVAPGQGTRVKGNSLMANGRFFAGFARQFAGALTAVLNDASLLHNHVANNFVGGIFCTQCVGAEVRGNKLRENAGPAVSILFSREISVQENVMHGGAGRTVGYPAVLISKSRSINVFRNLVVDAFHPFKFTGIGTDETWCGKNMLVHENTIITSAQSELARDMGLCASDRVERNRYWNHEARTSIVGPTGEILLSDEEGKRGLIASQD